MVKIRLSKAAAKHKPSWRIVVVDSRKKREGKYLDIIGFLNAKTKPPTVKVDQKRLDFWLKSGAQLSPTLKKFIFK